jgi:hypothetical protein
MGRVQFRLRRSMATAAVLAVFLVLPPQLQFLLMLPAIVATLILVPAALAPRARRVEVAYWATALHPLAFLVWLAAWRFLLDPRTLYPRDSGWSFTLTLEVPYILAVLTRLYPVVFLAVGVALATSRFTGRSLTVPLLLTVAVWLSTWAILAWDPFAMGDWFWGRR